jgi:hypothetical protein
MNERACLRCGKVLSEKRLKSGDNVIYCSKLCKKRNKRSVYQKRRMLVDDEIGRKIKAGREKYTEQVSCQSC